MTFDEQLKRAFETLTERVHDEITREVQRVVDELAASAQAEREQAVNEARDRAVAEVREQAIAEANAVAEARAAAEAAAALAATPVEPEPSTPETIPSHSDHANRLLDALREIDAAHTLSQILDALLNCASREVDRVALLLVRNDGYRAWRSIGFDPPFDRGASVDLPEGAPVMPIAIGGQVVAVLHVDHGEVESHPALEILTRHAARCLETVTAFKAARAALAADTGDRHAATADDANADEGAARRYARLLVSEIKLYHESDVIAGRRERDLATRLGGEIARARGLYEERVPAQIRRRADYFHDELVRTLANGDSTLLELRT